MVEAIKVGVIGMGFGADVQIPALLSVPGVMVSGVADAGSGRAARVASRMEQSPQVFATGAELIASDDVHAVVVATPPREQAGFVEQALTVEKPVICEKPLGLTLQVSEDLAARVRARKAVVAVGFEFRYDSGIRLLREALRDDRIGALERVDVAWITAGGTRKPTRWSWRHDIGEAGGIITDFAIHVVDYIRWLSGEDIDIRAAMADIRVRERTDREGCPQRVTSPDSVDFLAGTASGVCVNAVVSNAYPVAFGHRIELTGRKGRLTFFHRPPFGWADLDVTLDAGGRKSSLMVPTGANAAALPGWHDTRVAACAALFHDFARAIRGEAVDDLPGFDDATAARRATHAIEAAAGYAR